VNFHDRLGDEGPGARVLDVNLNGENAVQESPAECSLPAGAHPDDAAC
jgi:MerR family redox-sensitive transcriptional activator SoxR